MRKILPLFLVSAVLLAIACNPAFRPGAAQYSAYRIGAGNKQDSVLLSVLRPYSDSINKSMNDVIGYNETMLSARNSINLLGYFMADAYLFMAKEKFNTHVDAAFMNRGGVRLQEFPAGSITRGKIFELMPFDNLLMVQVIKGSVLKQLLDTIAFRDQLILAGISLQLKNKLVGQIMVGGKPLNENADYTIVNSDYSINTSDILRKYPQRNIGYLQRDAIIDYISRHTKQGKKITVEEINRISYAD